MRFQAGSFQSMMLPTGPSSDMNVSGSAGLGRKMCACLSLSYVHTSLPDWDCANAGLQEPLVAIFGALPRMEHSINHRWPFYNSRCLFHHCKRLHMIGLFPFSHTSWCFEHPRVHYQDPILCSQQPCTLEMGTDPKAISELIAQCGRPPQS